MAPPRSFTRFKARVLKGARSAPYPGFVEPCLAVPARKVPHGDRWVHELALGGLRTQAHLAEGRVTLYAESGLDCSGRFPDVAGAVAMLPATHAILDGEIIAPEKGCAGRPTSPRNPGRPSPNCVVYCAFDLLYLDGFDIRDAALVDRKRVLAELLAEAGLSRVLVSQHVDDGEALLRQARAKKLAGTVSKQRDAPYRSGRSESWIWAACARHRA